MLIRIMVNCGTFDNCFRSQEENGICRNVVLPISSAKCDRSAEALADARKHPERLTAFCSVHPHDPDTEEKVFNYKKLGAAGYKLKITDIEMKNDFKPLLKTLKICCEARLPVILHTGSLTHIKRENSSALMWKLLKCTRVELFGELLSELPRDFTFVFGHSGIAEYKLVAEYMKRFPSTYAELSCQSEDSIRYLMENVGPERLLFGSDWPALPQALTLSRVLAVTDGTNVPGR